MERTPQSSMSPYSVHPSYPSPAQSDINASHQAADQGLGIYDCSMPASSSIYAPTILTAPWTHTDMSESSHLQPTQSVPDIFSPAYDPFASYQSAARSPYCGDTYSHSTSARDIPLSPVP